MTLRYTLTGTPRSEEDFLDAVKDADVIDAYLYREESVLPQVMVDEPNGLPTRIMLEAGTVHYDLGEADMEGDDVDAVADALDIYLSRHEYDVPELVVHGTLSAQDKERIARHREEVYGTMAPRHYIPLLGGVTYSNQQRLRYEQRRRYFQAWERDAGTHEQLERRGRRLTYSRVGVLAGSAAAAAWGSYTGNDTLFNMGAATLLLTLATADIVIGKLYAKTLEEYRGDPEEVRTYMDNVFRFEGRSE